MAEITASMVKELREASGAGMMDCKTALNENDGNMEAAIDWLRTKGLPRQRKSGRVAADGWLVVSGGTSGAVVEVNSETDFVARNETFQGMVTDISAIALNTGGDHDALLAADYPAPKSRSKPHVQEMVGTIGENMTVRRSKTLSVSDGVVASYMHSQVADGLGKIGVLVALQSTGDKEKLDAGRQLAMHVAATNPLAVNVDSLNPVTLNANAPC
ncbi:MAG: hypothetical protein CM15mP21_3320 [Hyphomicrobiales bacterium]|nr:MAG: hypothetical protein CM15mP21_3320 [Hyphomicrobiales bacterium]